MKLLKKLSVFLLIILFLAAAFFLLRNYAKKPLIVPPVPVSQQTNLWPRFVVFSDIHSDFKNLEKALEIAKKDQMEFIAITGDLTTLGKKEELTAIKKILDQSGLEYYVVSGNHDLWFGKQIKKDVFSEVFGKQPADFQKGNSKYILINNGDEDSGIENLSAVEQQVKDCPKIYCLVFLHEPLNHPYSKHIMGENDTSVASQTGLLVNMFNLYQIKEIFAGHLHFSSTYELDGLKTTIVGSLSSERNTQLPRFLEVISEKERREVTIE